MRDTWNTDGEYEANLREDWQRFQTECMALMHPGGRTFREVVAETGGDPEDVAVALGYRNTSEAQYRLGSNY